ncbi:MAG: class I SAM-dependent methyltransferase [Candidatus Aminicenantes bacterium]|nr:class I SAM-dependent methyltransferase [Candidatus Aminicenantes bacterium]
MTSKNPSRRYYAHYPLSHPAWLAVRLAGARIEAAATRHFRGSLIDIGCGDKWKSDLVGRFVEQYTGVDHADTIHDHSAIDRIGSAYALPAADNEFDCVLCTSVLEHLEEPEAALREALRVLKPGGAAIYTVPQIWHLHEEPRDFFRFTRYGLQYLFSKAGFELVEIEALSGFWATFGSEFSNYLNSFRWRWLRPFIAWWTVLNNLFFLLLEKMHRNPKWTWAHLVVVHKPAPLTIESPR